MAGRGRRRLEGCSYSGWGQPAWSWALGLQGSASRQWNDGTPSPLPTDPGGWRRVWSGVAVVAVNFSAERTRRLRHRVGDRKLALT